MISVVIPVYNEEARVARAIQSILDQTWSNLEVIVVDDHSTDGTAQAVKSMLPQDKRLAYHLLPEKPPQRTNWRGYDINAGFAARNYRFKIAKGEWITTQDSDDASILNRIEVQYRMAQKYAATCVTIQWQQLVPEVLGKRLDVDAIFRDKGEDEIVIRPEAIIALAKKVRGPLMVEPVHKYVPFPIKWFPYTRWLFFRTIESYPGADNCMLFHKSVRDEGVYMRPRNERTWGVPSGRGSGRDFAFHIAMHTRNAWSFRFPMYLWDVHKDNPDYPLEASASYLLS